AAADGAADQQPAQDRGPRGARPEDRAPRADRHPGHRPQPALPGHQARQARPPARSRAGGDVSAEDAGNPASGRRFCLVAARYNQRWVDRLVRGARDVLIEHGVAEPDLETVWVPGSLELPLACRWATESGRFDAVIALGVVLRGETEHFRIVTDVSAHGLGRVALDTGVPVLNAVLAADRPE